MRDFNGCLEGSKAREREEMHHFSISSLTDAFPLSKDKILASCLAEEHQFMEGVGTCQ